MTMYKWSQTAATNATADSSINWAEGQAPSSVNDSARALMAAVAKYRDDTGGVTSTGGAADAYTLTTSQVFTSYINGMEIGFRIHANNTGASTINVDGLGTKALRVVPSTALAADSLVNGSIYTATYRSAGNEFLIHNAFGNALATTPDLAAIEALTATTGVLRKTAANTWALDAGVTHLANTTASRIYGTNSSGVSGLITVGTGLSLSGGTLSNTLSGGVALLTSQVVSSSVASVAFTGTPFTADYDTYLFQIDGLQPATNDVELRMHMSTDGGSTWGTSYRSNLLMVSQGVAAVNASVSTSIAMGGDHDGSTAYGISSGGSAGWYGDVTIQPRSTGNFKRAWFRGTYERAAGGVGSVYAHGGGAFVGSTSAVTAVRFIFSSGNVAAGTIRLYGYRNS